MDSPSFTLEAKTDPLPHCPTPQHGTAEDTTLNPKDAVMEIDGPSLRTELEGRLVATDSSTFTIRTNNDTEAAAAVFNPPPKRAPPGTRRRLKEQKEKEGKRVLKWGATGIRSSVLAKLQPPPPPVPVEGGDSPTDSGAPSEEATELRRLLDALHDGLKRLDHRRCLLVLTYLLHARHLIRPDVLNYKRCGATVAALTYSSHAEVAECATTMMKLWRYGLSEGMRLEKVKELERRLNAVRESFQ